MRISDWSSDVCSSDLDHRTRSDQRRRPSVTLNPSRWSFRNQCLAGFAACVALVGFAIFSQFQWNLQPCPLCIFQRIAFAALALVLLVAGLPAPKGATGRRVYGVLALVPALAGLAIAARPVWLTPLPAHQVPGPESGRGG